VQGLASEAVVIFRRATVAQCCLTPRSSGAPTAGHQARAGGTRYIFTGPGLASCRCRPLSSNVRPCRQQMRRRNRAKAVAPTASHRRQSAATVAKTRALAIPRPPGNHEPRQAVACQRLPHVCTGPAKACGKAFSWRARCPHAASRARPNSSVNRSANGLPPAPGLWHLVHHHRPGAGGKPSSPGYLER
jgi:hypothetical protein